MIKRSQIIGFLLFVTAGMYTPLFSGNNATLTATPSFTVQWTGQFASTKDFRRNTGFAARLLHLMLGTEVSALQRPVAVWPDTDGLMRVLDQGHRALIIINNQKQTLKSVSPFPSPVSLCTMDGQKLLFTDSRQNRIYIQEKPDQLPRILNKSLHLNRPTGIAFLKQKQQIWVVETASHRIAVLDTSGRLIRHIGQRGSAAGEFNFPTFIWIDQSGTVFVVDAMNFRVQILNSDGTPRFMFGEAGDASGYFARPKGIATDSYGHIYVADALFHTVQIFDQQGRYLDHFGRQGTGQGDFWMPNGIFIDPADHIYVADSYNARIQIFKLQQR